MLLPDEILAMLENTAYCAAGAGAASSAGINARIRAVRVVAVAGFKQGERVGRTFGGQTIAKHMMIEG
ncbi:MAG TPA: hypothetical protein VF614_02380 [Chthoniobacteraceae bacterium]|jgi:hypothetical protein